MYMCVHMYMYMYTWNRETHIRTCIQILACTYSCVVRGGALRTQVWYHPPLCGVHVLLKQNGGCTHTHTHTHTPRYNTCVVRGDPRAGAIGVGEAA